ncbi:MAG: hypothetical protein JW768_03580 [Chitinispirillaceae bacterium]|nr:hypothetical protein [Chitinispirillaceae bacterium]
MFARYGKVLGCLLFAAAAVVTVSCGDNPNEPAAVRIKNNFNDTNEARTPPWTICRCNYRGVEFGKILLGDTSAAHEVAAGLDYVLMVASWDDTACSTSNCLPIASKIEEEVVEGQTRVISIQASNHQGPCPPAGIAPIPEDLYNRILALWPEYGFETYANRALNPQCQ